jgi:hypothetical protein
MSEKKVVNENINQLKINNVILKKFVMARKLAQTTDFCYTFAA